MRQSELVRVRVDDLDREHHRIENVWSPKAPDDQRTRTVYYHPSLDSLLRLWLEKGRHSYRHAESSEYLLLSERNSQMHPTKASKVVKDAAENAGIQEVIMEDTMGRERHRITAHALRHGFAVHALDQGIDLKKLSDLLGHGSLETTQIYLQYVDRDLEEAYRRHFSP